jgi:hypothetical protein
MLVNSDKTSKTRILSVLIACETCGIQLIPNIGFEIILDYKNDYGGNIVKGSILLQCPGCLSTEAFEDYAS